MNWLVGNWAQLGEVAGKAALMYAAALLGLRMGQRRTLAQWTITDFITAVAIGAVVGRTAVAPSQSFVTGLVAMVSFIVAHRLASLLRLQPVVRRLFDHRVRVLVASGELQRVALRHCGLTDEDVFSHLRENDVFDLANVRYLLYEAKGALTIVRADAAEETPLVQSALERSTGGGS